MRYPAKIMLENFARSLVLLCIFLLVDTHSTSTLTYVAVVLFYLAGHFKEKIRWGFAFHMNYALAGFLLMLLIGMWYSPASLSTRFATFWKYADKLLLFFFLIPLFVEEKWRRWAIFLFVISTFFNMLLWTGNLHRSIGWVDQALHLFHHIFGLFATQSFSSSVAIVSYILLLEVPRYPRLKWLCVVGALLCIYFSFFVNHERVGMVTEIILLALFLLQTSKRPAISIGILILACVIVYFISPVMHNRVTELLINDTANHSSISVRLENTKESLFFIEKKPFFGWGTGSYQMIQNHYFPNDIPYITAQKAPENGFLYIAAEVGTVGLVLVLAWLFLQWREAYLFLPIFEARIASAFIIGFVLMSITASQFSSHFELIKQVIMVSMLFGASKNIPANNKST